MEQVVTLMYTLDILFRFMRMLPEDKAAGHLKIAKRYAYSGALFVDVLATFPFDLIKSMPD